MNKIREIIDSHNFSEETLICINCGRILTEVILHKTSCDKFAKEHIVPSEQGKVYENKEMQTVSPHQIPEEKIREIINIPQMTYCCFIFDFAQAKPIRANVEFSLNGEQVKKLLELLADGSWRNNRI